MQHGSASRGGSARRLSAETHHQPLQQLSKPKCSRLAPHSAGEPCALLSTSTVQVKQYFAAITSRRNTITGLLYRDDPTIMSWASRGRQIAV